MTGPRFSFHRGAHASLLYENHDEQKAVVLPFIQEGLKAGEHCVYVADEQSIDDWCFEFQAYGIDVDTEQRKGSLLVCAGEHWRQPGIFSSVENGRQTWRMIEHALANFKGIRFAVDTGWMLDPPIAADLICHWEATLNVVIAGDIEVRTLCQYNLQRHSTATIHAALRTHPIALLRGRAFPNPYYEAPRILEDEPNLNHSHADAGMIEGMLLELAKQPELP